MRRQNPWMLWLVVLLAAALTGCGGESEPVAGNSASAVKQPEPVSEGSKPVADDFQPEMRRSQPATESAEDGWIPLFDGRTLEGWEVGANPDSFSVKDGVLVAQGARAHLFYAGELENHHFTDFHLKADVLTTHGSNSGIYFHTQFQEAGWPQIGYEVQINQTNSNPKKSGSLYGVRPVLASSARDDEWYTQEIIVRGKQIIAKINGETVLDFTEPDNWTDQRRLSSGTFALQASGVGGAVSFRNILVKPLDTSE